jgi:type IV secretion system protein VirB11
VSGIERPAVLGLRALRERRLEGKLQRELGPTLSDLLGDAQVVEVMRNEDGRIWVDRLGSGLAPAPFEISAEMAENLLGTVAALLGTVINEEHPILEGELPFHGARFEGVLPPVSRGPVFSIRKRAASIHRLEEYVQKRQLTPRHHAELLAAIERQESLVVCGGTGSGKTTLLNALLAEKVRLGDPHQRIVILEDTVELQCTAPNTVQLRTSAEADLRRLVRATMRLRPDTIVIGEVRGREALDLLKAWNTGHRGGLSSVHANGAEAALSRLDQLVQEAGVPTQPRLLAEAIDWIVGMSRVDGDRRVTELVHVDGVDTHGQFQLTAIEP